MTQKEEAQVITQQKLIKQVTDETQIVEEQTAVTDKGYIC
jgi:hypothetical protein